MTVFKDFDSVKVVRLVEPDRPYDGSATPRVGDTGAIVHIYSVDGQPTGYIVENVAPDGTTIWLADFLPDEIEAESMI